MNLTPLLAHAGPGASWQAAVVVAGVVLAGAALAVGVGLLTVAGPRDLTGPVITATVAGALGVLGREVFSDAIGWGLPLAVIAGGTLLLGGLTGVDLRFPAPLPMGALALAAVSAWLLYEPLTIALHPPVEILPASDDAEVAVQEPAEDAIVPAGPVAVTVAVTGGSIGPGDLAVEALPADPEEAGALLVAIAEVRADGSTGPVRGIEVVDDVEVAGCSLAAPCREVSVGVEVAPGTWRLTVELARGDGTPLAPPVRAQRTFTAVAGG